MRKIKSKFAFTFCFHKVPNSPAKIVTVLGTDYRNLKLVFKKKIEIDVSVISRDQFLEKLRQVE